MVENILKMFAGLVGTRSPTTLSKTRNRYPAEKRYRPDLGIEFKSKMEANTYRFYKYIEQKFGKIKVSYEPERFYFKPNKFGIRAYVPDFKIVAGSFIYYVEVKGFMDNTSRQKAWLMQQNYPWIRVFFLTSRGYEIIKRNYSHLVKGWE